MDREFGDLLGAEHPQAADPEIARTVVRHTWDLSLAQLHTDGYTLARPLLHLLALLEAAPIPRSLITPALLADATGQDVTATALDTALAGLHQYALLGAPRTTADASAENGASVSVGQLVLHPVVREVMALTAPAPTPPPGTPPSMPTSPRPSRTPSTPAAPAGPPPASLHPTCHPCWTAPPTSPLLPPATHSTLSRAH
ncbi:hypothetical protein [Streptomyces rochei]|uniref:hypothetical protein n=1 Tax=Streptomyces rochei TaxID=1928 RepID=UPI0036B632A7